MKVVVDANLVFSAILNTNSRVGDLLINSYTLLDFIAPDFLRTEIQKHQKRLVKISGLTVREIKEAQFQVCKDIKFISEEQISKANWELAYGFFGHGYRSKRYSIRCLFFTIQSQNLVRG